MIQKHIYILKENELILLSDIIKLEQKAEFEINISECDVNKDIYLCPKTLKYENGFRFVFTPSYTKQKE